VTGLPPWLRPSRRILQVQSLRSLVEQNDQRRPNGTLYKRFWTLAFNPYSQNYDWTINHYKYLTVYDEVLAFAEVGVNGR